MKKLFTIITSLFTINTLKAQSVPYEILEKLSKEINNCNTTDVKNSSNKKSSK